jgi:hypothetical protein
MAWLGSGAWICGGKVPVQHSDRRLLNSRCSRLHSLESLWIKDSQLVVTAKRIWVLSPLRPFLNFKSKNSFAKFEIAELNELTRFGALLMLRPVLPLEAKQAS